MSGHLIICRVCGGTGRARQATAVECSGCDGRGTNWQYEDGSTAVYQGGRFTAWATPQKSLVAPA